MVETQEEKFIRMTEGPIGKVIAKLAVPCIISMLVTSFYNMADTFFVGLLKSNSATGAVGVAFSMMAIIQAVGFFFGQGSGNYISRELGKKNYREAEKMAATGFFLAFISGLIIMLVGELFIEELAVLLGSTDTILPYAVEYLGAILLGTPWITTSFVLNNQLRFQGNAAYAMVGITFGAILNIALDPILIFTFDMGIAGAGYATVISQFVSFCILIYGMQKKGGIKLKFSNISLKWIYFKNIFEGGLPSLARQGLASVATISLNHAAGPFGDEVIAAMGVVQRIAMFGSSAMIGFGQGFQPFCGFNYGAGLYKRVKKGFYFCVKTSVVFLLIIAAAGFIFAPELISLFRDDPKVIEVGTTALRLQCVTFVFHSWVVLSNMTTQVIGKTVPATFLATARQGLFFIPAVLILSNLIGVLGIQLAQPISDIGTLLCAIPIQLKVLKEMENKSTIKKENEKMNIWHDLSPKRVKPDDFFALIEIPKGSKNKYELDKETGLLKLDRVLYTSTHYPASYGFIPRTYADDGDPLDVLVLCSEDIYPMTLVRCKPIGVIKMTDNGAADEKIIAVPFDDPTYNSYNDISEIPSHIYSEMMHFFEVYKALENKQTVVDEVCNVEEAKRIIEYTIDKYVDSFCK